MAVYAQFGLSRAPFESRLDEDLYYDGAQHAETLATLRYMIRSGQTAVAVVGESGMGKTYLARVLATTLTGGFPIVWVPGLGQKPDATRALLLRSGASPHKVKPRHTTLADALCPEDGLRGPVLTIIDDADSLESAHWREITALCTQEIAAPRQLHLIMLGSPKLRDRLAEPDVARLRRRVFRVCPLRPLTTEEVHAYVGRRIAVAGGDTKALFADQALDQIARLARGNPGLINQLCDNALIEACGAERQRVLTRDVLQAVYAMLGVTESQTDARRLPGELSVDTTVAPAEIPPAPVESPAPVEAEVEPEIGPPPAVGPAPRSPSFVSEARANSFEQRMRGLQERMKQALDAVRAAGGTLPTAQPPAAEPIRIRTGAATPPAAAEATVDA